MKRSSESDLTWSESAADCLLSPLLVVGASGTCQILLSNEFCHSVMGTTIFRRSFPTPSELMTTAGRVLLISCPLVGLRSMSQISPRFGNVLLVLIQFITLRGFPAIPIL